jgi:glutathione reductase (NADPH)
MNTVEQTRFDTVVLGAGNAGQAAAAELREAGKSVLVIESRDVGGTCPLRGCVPKKVLIAAAETLDIIARAARVAVDVPAPRLDWARLMAHKRAILAGTVEGGERWLSHKGIRLVHGRARFTSDRTVSVDGAVYQAEHIVVATGARPRPLDVDGASHAITSEDLLELEALPESLLFIGAGVIAFEFTHVFARAGVKVTMLEVGKRPLASHDPDCIERLVAATTRLGVTIEREAKVRRIEQKAGGFVVRYEQGGSERSIAVANVANGSGRVADYEGLALDTANVEMKDGAPTLTSQLQSTSNPRVWFVGDARPGPQLSPVATFDGRSVARAILGSKEPILHDAMPSVVYTIPPLASVGQTEEQAHEAGHAFDVISNDMHEWKSSRTYGEDEAYGKVLVEKGTGRILGAHLLRLRADESIHAFAFAMKHGVTAKSLREEVFAFPTYTADTKYLVG